MVNEEKGNGYSGEFADIMEDITRYIKSKVGESGGFLLGVVDRDNGMMSTAGNNMTAMDCATVIQSQMDSNPEIKASLIASIMMGRPQAIPIGSRVVDSSKPKN